MATGIDSLSIKDFETPYNVTRSNGQSNLSHKTQDTAKLKPAAPAPAAFGMAAMIEAIASKVVAILDLRQSEQPTPQIPSPTADPLANLRALQEACDRGWLLSSSQLAPLVGLKNVHGKAFERYGFKFVKAGKNGSESAWRIEKS